MKRNTILAIGIAAAIAAATPVLADGNGKRGHDGQGNGMMGANSANGGHDMAGGQGMQNMMRMHAMMGNGMDGSGMKGGMMGGFNAGEGAMTPQEAIENAQAQLKKFDTDGNGSLSVEEFEALHSDRIRNKMVDRFQELDADGDGQVTNEEIAAPAERMMQMQERRAAHNDADAGMQNHGQGNMTKNN